LRVPDEVYYRNALCALSLISTVFFKLKGLEKIEQMNMDYCAVSVLISPDLVLNVGVQINFVMLYKGGRSHDGSHIFLLLGNHLLKQIMKVHNKIHSHDHATIVYF